MEKIDILLKLINQQKNSLIKFVQPDYALNNVTFFKKNECVSLGGGEREGESKLHFITTCLLIPLI